MRAVLLLLALATFFAALPVASAGGDLPPVQCDVDDDLYQHCNAGPVNVVYGPACAGVALGQPATCHDLREILQRTLA